MLNIKTIAVMSIALIVLTEGKTYTNTGRFSPIEKVSRSLISDSTGNYALNFIRPIGMNLEYGILGVT